MLINLYFGDYYDDGHGHYYHTCVEAESADIISAAKEKIKEDYPHFFDQLAYHYMDNSIGPEVEKALLAASYPAERFCEKMDDTEYDEFESLEAIFNSELWEDNEHRIYTIELVADIVIWMLNYYGANVIEVEKPKYPTVTFTAGYGLFE